MLDNEHAYAKKSPIFLKGYARLHILRQTYADIGTRDRAYPLRKQILGIDTISELAK